MEALESPNNKGLIGCLLNCSGNGVCKTGEDSVLKCDCFQNFTGEMCNIDLRACKYSPCLNKAECEDIIDTKTNSYDFKCKCKGLSYGKYCELKLSACFNETCSLHGYCLESNGKAECKCLYLYEGHKCEIETYELMVRKEVKKGSYIIAIIIVIFYYLLLFLMDILDFLIKRRRRRIYKKKKIFKFFYVNLVYL